MDCLFCKIANKQIAARVAFENERVIAFHDLFPQAPTHVLVIPKTHYSTLNDVPPADAGVLGELVTSATAIARELGLADNGYRVVMNCNADGGQSVYHIHLHLLGGRAMAWPPG